MTNKDKFLALVSEEDSKVLDRNRDRIRNRAMLRESQQIALKVLLKLDELGWTQKELANRMDVSPQQVSKIVSGKENLTIESQIKLQTILDIPILASYYEEHMEEMILSFEKRIDEIVAQAMFVSDSYQSTTTYQETNIYQLSTAG